MPSTAAQSVATMAIGAGPVSSGAAAANRASTNRVGVTWEPSASQATPMRPRSFSRSTGTE